MPSTALYRVADPEIQGRLSAWAWERCEEAATTGHVTLLNGTILDLLSADKEIQNRARTYLTHIRWLASLSAKKRARAMPPPLSDEFRLVPTR